MQGTFLKESIGKELEAMSSHVALNQASDKVRQIHTRSCVTPAATAPTMILNN